jgi:S1-C subfamily serine protease
MANEMGNFSAASSLAASRAAGYTVGVDGRGGYPSSGVIFAPKLVLSADHSVERQEDIRILMPDGSEQRAEVAGRDPISDLILLELDEEVGKPAELAADKAEIGQLVLALGRPTEEGVQASLGILSIVNGTYRSHRGVSLQGVIRSDAKRFPGFAGGPLVDMGGGLVGVNTFSSSAGTSITIPAGLAWKTAEKLKTGEGVKPGYLGIRSQQVELPQPPPLDREQNTGLLIVGIETESPAAKAGFMVGDILVGLDGKAVRDHEELLEQLLDGMGGTTATVELLRGGRREEVSVAIGTLERPLRTRRPWHGRGCR